MNKIILIIGGVLVVIVGGYFLLRGIYQAPTPTPTGLTPPTVSPEEITSAPKEVVPPEEKVITPPDLVGKEFTVSGTEYRFNPSSITVSAGERVKVIFKNEGRIIHDFTIRDLGIKTKVISPGQTDALEFTAPTSGTYTFICSVPGHATAGMIGDLIVK